MNESDVKSEIMSYLLSNPDKHINSIDIVSHLRVRVDISYKAILELDESGHIRRHNGPLGGWNGNHYYTVTALGEETYKELVPDQ